MGPLDLLTSRQALAQPMGLRSYDDARRRAPVLALDMFEHSYHIDYGAKSAVHIDAFMNVIRWDNPAKLYDRYSREAS
jgi:superoxide dismutase